MMANRYDRPADEQDDQRQQALEAIAGDIRGSLEQASAIEEVIRELETEHIRGEDVQDELNAVFQECEALTTLARLDRAERLETAIEEAMEHGFLNADERARFESLWSEIGWIAPGVQAFDDDQEGIPRHWTGQDASLERVRGQLVIEHTFQHGVDTVHRIRVPAEKLFTDGVRRLLLVAGVLPTAIEKGDLGTEAVEQILDARSNLEEVLERLEQIAPDEPPEGDGDDTVDDDDETLEDLGELFQQSDDEEGSEPETAMVGFE